VERKRNEGFEILDTRPSPQYGTGHIPGSLNIGLGGQFASWAGALMGARTSVILVAEDEASVREARTRLARVGLENVAGYLAGGILEWDRAGLPLARVEQISAGELRARLQEADPPRLLDVRRPLEWQAGHIPAAIHIPLHELSQKGDALDKEARVAVICAGGFRSSIGTSILERLGFKQVTNVIGGMAAYSIDD
jgi:hydroxyacylglutathione hydrolase